MLSAEQIATTLGYEFLRDGRFSNSTGPVEVPPVMQAAAGAAGGGADVRHELEAFGGLAVQAVGYEEGVDNPAVHIYLARGSSKLIRSLPSEISGVRVNTQKMGPINVRPESTAASTNQGYIFERNGRVCCGSSCAPTSENLVGTVGALVTLNGSSDLFILSNNHVFGGCNHVPRGQPILSPGSGDGRPNVRAPGEIGRHELIEELRTGNPNFVTPMKNDLALARATDTSAISSWQGDDKDGYDTPSQSVVPKTFMKVKKFGRTTALTFGTVRAKVNVPTPITYNAKHFKGVVWFKDVWTVRSLSGSPFALPGDSGSLVVTDDGANAVGVLFAASPNGEYGWIIPMSDVLATFGGLQLLTGHGI